MDERWNNQAPTEMEGTLLEEQGTLKEETLLEAPSAPKGLAASATDELPAGFAVGPCRVLRVLATSTSSGKASLYLVDKAGKLYVMKVFVPGESGADPKVRAILKGISCPYLMPIFTEGQLPDGRRYEIIPYYRQGTMEKHRGPSIEKALPSYVRDLNEAIHALHQADIIHGDIKPQNIFMTDDGQHVVLGDFDIARFLNGRDFIQNDPRMTRKYAAPEVAMTPSTILKESDMYSFGMTLRCIAHSHDEIFDVLTNEGYAAQRALGESVLPMDIPGDMRDLIHMLTDAAPKKRADYDLVKEWVAHPEYYRGKAPRARFADQNPSIRSMSYNGKACTTLWDLAEAFNSDWRGLPRFLGAREASGEFYFVRHLMDSGLQDKAIDAKAILSSKKPFYNVVFLILHLLNPGIGMTLEGRRFPGLKEFFDAVYEDPSFALDPKMFRYDILVCQATQENNADFVDELQQLQGHFPAAGDEDWMDVVLNYFRREDCFYLKGKKLPLSEYLDALVASVSQGQEPYALTRRAPFLQDFFIHQGKLPEEQGKAIFRAASSEDASRFLSRLSYALLGEFHYSLPGGIAHNMKEWIDLSNRAYSRGNAAEIKSFEKLYADGGEFSFALSLEKMRGGEGAYEDIKNRLTAAKPSQRMAVLYYITDESPRYRGFANLDELTKHALACPDPEAEFSSIMKDEAFQLWTGTFTRKKQ